jgi:sec-independent protein translocase protein TatC
LIDHLDELRRRLLYALAAVCIGTLLAYGLYDLLILPFLKAPLDALAGRIDNPFIVDNPLLRALCRETRNLPENSLALHMIDPLEGVMTKVKASFFGGFILAFPVVLLQAWKFIAIGLTPVERRGIRVFLPAALLLFVAGVAVAHALLLPPVFYFLLVAQAGDIIPQLTVSRYVLVVAYACLAAGLIAQMPLLILLLTRIGLVTPQQLAAKRKYAILFIFIVAAILTPPDVVTQILLALPMMVLYEFSIILARLGSRSTKGGGQDG